MTTQTIAGHKITLEPGKRYFASRPAAKRGKISRQQFTITIKELNGLNNFYSQSDEIKIRNLTYNQANQFLAEFNNEECSLSGRVW